MGACEGKSGNRQQYSVLDGGHGGQVLDDGQVSADVGANGVGGVVLDFAARSAIEAVPVCYHVREISKAAVETCIRVFICLWLPGSRKDKQCRALFLVI